MYEALSWINYYDKYDRFRFPLIQNQFSGLNKLLRCKGLLTLSDCKKDVRVRVFLFFVVSLQYCQQWHTVDSLLAITAKCNLKSMRGLAPRTSIASWLPSNLTPCCRSVVTQLEWDVSFAITNKNMLYFIEFFTMGNSARFWSEFLHSVFVGIKYFWSVHILAGEGLL